MTSFLFIFISSTTEFRNLEYVLMNIRIFRILLPVFAVVLMVESAHGQHFDIFLARPATGTGTQTVVGGADVDAQVFTDDTRVFESELGVLGSEYFALEPGV